VSALSNEFQPTVIVLSQPKAVKVFPLFARRHFNPVLVNFFDLFICKQFAYLLMVSVWLNMPNTRSHITMPSDNFLKCYQMPFFFQAKFVGLTGGFFQPSQLCVRYLSINKRIRGQQNETVSWKSSGRPWQPSPFDSLTCRTKNFCRRLRKSGLFAKVWKNEVDFPTSQNAVKNSRSKYVVGRMWQATPPI